MHVLPSSIILLVFFCSLTVLVFLLHGAFHGKIGLVYLNYLTILLVSIGWL